MKKALCVGISDYGSPQYNLPGVANDVASIATLLSGDGGSFGSNLRVVLDSEATKQRIVDELEAIFSADPEDELFVYMAGHGMVDNNRYYFVPFGPRLGLSDDWALPLPVLKEFFDECTARRVLVYLDFCHSGGVIPRDVDGSNIDARDVFQREITISGGIGKMLYAACTENQSAYEDVASQYGYFTRAIANGLRGSAVNANGEVTTNSLYDFVSSELDALSLPQQPMQFGQMTGRMVLRFDAARSTTPSIPQGFHQSADSNQVEIGNSGTICMVGDYFFSAAEVNQSNDEIELIVESIDPATASLIDNLRALAGRQVAIKYGHQDRCFQVYVMGVSTSYSDNVQTCSIKLKELAWRNTARSETAYSENGRTYSPLDIAVIAARKILLNEDLEQEHHEPGKGSSFSYMPISALIGVDFDDYCNSCSLQILRERFESDHSMWLKAARLLSIYSMKEMGIADQITSLKFVKLNANTIRVTFEGKRPRYFQNVEPESITVNGDFIV